MSAAATTGESRTTSGGVTPVLVVRDLDASLQYYLGVLGFALDFRQVIASVSRDRCALFLSQGDQGHPGSWVWIGVSDVEALFAEYRDKGARIRQPPTNFSWACEMQVEDLDGNVLRMGSDPRPGAPLGPWLDMHGDRWQPGPDGRWVRVPETAPDGAGDGQGAGSSR